MTRDQELLTISDCSRALGISVEGVRRRIASGELQAIKLGERTAPLRVRPADLETYIDAHAVVPR